MKGKIYEDHSIVSRRFRWLPLFWRSPRSHARVRCRLHKLATEDSMHNPGGRRIQTSPGSLITHGLTLRGWLMFGAYNMPAQIIGPDWLNDVSLDIVAKAATPAGDKQLYQMLRTLLTERLGLRAHFEKREMPVYALTIAKTGTEIFRIHHRWPTGLWPGQRRVGATTHLHGRTRRGDREGSI